MPFRGGGEVYPDFRGRGVVLNKLVACGVVAATAATAATAAADEPGGFRAGLYAGEVGGGLFASTPVLVPGATLVVLGASAYD